MTRFGLLVVALAACSHAPTSATQSDPAPIASAIEAPKSAGLRAEIVPVIGGLFPVTKPDSAGTPVPTSLVLRVHNDSDAPVVLRTGGDDEGFEIKVRGAGLVNAAVSTPCHDLWAFGAKHVIAAHGSLDVPLRTFRSGERCHETAHYLTTPGLYEIDVTLRAHIHASDAPPGKGERGKEILLTAPKVTLQAG
jgi:hypothetical protein